MRLLPKGVSILFTDSKATGGFCVTRKGLLLSSKLGHILEDHPDMKEYVLPEGKFLRVGLGDELLSIRHSNIAFTMGAYGPLIEKEKNFKGTIETF